MYDEMTNHYQLNEVVNHSTLSYIVVGLNADSPLLQLEMPRSITSPHTKPVALSRTHKICGGL